VLQRLLHRGSGRRRHKYRSALRVTIRRAVRQATVTRPHVLVGPRIDLGLKSSGFTAEPWVEELHRYLSDHGGARVRSLVVEQSVALEESYNVLVASHRWPDLTHAFVADVHLRARRELGVHDRAEPAGRVHLASVNVDALIE